MTVDSVFSVDPQACWPGELHRLRTLDRRPPFEPDALAFVGSLSSCILRSTQAREFPELIALAHWFRPASLREMANRVLIGEKSEAIRARGLVFELAPSNVDVLFVYGWLLSLLTGNASIVRVSQSPSAVREMFLEHVRAVMQEDPAFRRVLSDSWIVTYAHDADVTGAISAECNARLIWGGDATVASIRSVTLNPLAVEAAFADRFSWAAFDAQFVLDEHESTLVEVARRFANDTLWFAQQACSSPRAVIWLGSPDIIARAQDRFWPLYHSAAMAFEDDSAALMARVADLFVFAAAGAIDGLTGPLAELPARGRGVAPAELVREEHSGYGMFVEYCVSDATAIAALLAEKDQTLVVHGLSDETIASLAADLPNRALDRIVRPGEAAAFATVWDGTDLFDVLTRKVTVPARIRGRA